MPDETEHFYQSVEMTRVGRIIRKLHDQVAGQRKRVEVTRPGCEDVCVMISKCELESLEQALSILADSKGFTEMCENLRQLLQSAGVVYTPAASGEENLSA